MNALTGRRQHTGNWRGKTAVRAESGFLYGEKRYKLFDLPGIYSLLSTSADEEVARDFILFDQPSVTIVVVDATRLERNLNLALQVLEITDRVVVALNLVDEAKRHGLRVDERAVIVEGQRGRFDFDRALDRILTSRTWGFPAMLALLVGVFWLTIAGASVPSQMLGTLLLDYGYNALHQLAAAIDMPAWLSGCSSTASTWRRPGLSR